VGAVEIVERDREIGEVPLVFLGNALDQRLGRDPLVLGTQHDGRAVGIVGADIVDLVLAHTLKPYPYIGLDVFHQVPQVDRAVGIGQGAGDQDFSFFCHGVSGRDQ